MGAAAENAYRNSLEKDGDLSLNFFEHAGILVSGTLGAISWSVKAKLGTGLLNIFHDLPTCGLSGFGSYVWNKIVSFDTLKEILKPKNLFINLGQSGLQSGQEIGLIFSKYMNGQKIELEEWKDLALTFGFYMILNTAEDVLRDFTIGYKAGAAVDSNKLVNAAEDTFEKASDLPNSKAPQDVEPAMKESEYKTTPDESITEPQKKSLGEIFKEKYPNAKEGIHYKIVQDTNGKEYIQWIDYDEYLAKTANGRQLISKSATKEQSSFISKYISESSEYSYKTANGLMRDNVFTLDSDGKITQITLHGIYSDEAYKTEDFWPLTSSGYTLEERIKYNKQGIIETDMFMRDNPLDEPILSFRGIPKSEGIEDIFGKSESELTIKDIQAYIDSEKTFETKGFLSTSITKSAENSTSIRQSICPSSSIFAAYSTFQGSTNSGTNCRLSALTRRNSVQPIQPLNACGTPLP